MVKPLSFARLGWATAEFEDLLRPHFAQLFRRAYALTGNTEDAEDLMQELCIRIYSHQDEVSRLDRPQAWMMRVLYRLFVDTMRSRKRSPVRLMASNPSYERLADSTASEEPGPERRTEAHMSGRRLRDAWARLTDDEQLLLTLHGIEGLSLAEIQEITGLPIGTIKSRLHRSRIRLGRLLKRAELQPPPDSRGRNHELPRRRKSSG